MSIVTRPRPISKNAFSFTEPVDGDLHIALSNLRNSAEAPEDAQSVREAPEARTRRFAEAPDAGERRGDFSDSEFTHGRSKS
jgi:hypothetical protein